MITMPLFEHEFPVLVYLTIYPLGVLVELPGSSFFVITIDSSFKERFCFDIPLVAS